MCVRGKEEKGDEGRILDQGGGGGVVIVAVVAYHRGRSIVLGHQGRQGHLER